MVIETIPTRMHPEIIVWIDQPPHEDKRPARNFTVETTDISQGPGGLSGASTTEE